MALTVELLGLPPSTLTGRRAQQFFTLHPSLGLRPRYLLAEPRPGRAVRGPPGSRSLAATIAPAAHNQVGNRLVWFVLTGECPHARKNWCCYVTSCEAA